MKSIKHHSAIFDRILNICFTFNLQGINITICVVLLVFSIKPSVIYCQINPHPFLNIINTLFYVTHYTIIFNYREYELIYGANDLYITNANIT